MDAIRFDGLYIFEEEFEEPIDLGDGTIIDYGYNVLKFFPNGQVVSMSMIDDLQWYPEWYNMLLPTSENISKGNYRISNSDLKFVLTKNDVTVIYDGKITSESLILTVESLKNGHKSVNEYDFYKI